MIETKQCSLCCAGPPYTDCYGRDADFACARLVMYETAKLPAVCDRGDAVNLALNMANGDTNEITDKGAAMLAHAVLKMDAYITELRCYASRLSVDVSLLNGIISRAARDAQKYVDAAERSIT